MSMNRTAQIAGTTSEHESVCMMAVETAKLLRKQAAAAWKSEVPQ